MKRNMKAEKKQMAEDIGKKLGLKADSETQKMVIKDLQKLRHFTLFALRHIAYKNKK